MKPGTRVDTPKGTGTYLLTDAGFPFVRLDNPDADCHSGYVDGNPILAPLCDCCKGYWFTADNVSPTKPDQSHSKRLDTDTPS